MQTLKIIIIVSVRISDANMLPGNNMSSTPYTTMAKHLVFELKKRFRWTYAMQLTLSIIKCMVETASDTIGPTRRNMVKDNAIIGGMRHGCGATHAIIQ
eukprot:scaffold1157_cov122-Cylindrotheca_fusiformis.AAC.24